MNFTHRPTESKHPNSRQTTMCFLLCGFFLNGSFNFAGTFSLVRFAVHMSFFSSSSSFASPLMFFFGFVLRTHHMNRTFIYTCTCTSVFDVNEAFHAAAIQKTIAFCIYNLKTVCTLWQAFHAPSISN